MRGKVGRSPKLLKQPVSNDLLTDWNVELCKKKETAVSAQTRAAGNSQKPDTMGTKDPSSSQITEAGQTVKPSKKGDV